MLVELRKYNTKEMKQQKVKEKKEQTPEAKMQRRVLTVLFFGVLMGALDIAIVGPALSAIGESFNVDERGLAWVFTMYVLFSLICSLIMGKLSDRYGRRNIFLMNIAIFGVGSLVVALSPNLAVMLVGRALQGGAAGGIFPVASAIIGDIFPAERRGRALGLIGAVFGIAFIIGPIIGGVLLLAGWHWLFLINIPISAIVFWYGLKTLPVLSTGVKSGRFDISGTIFLAIWITGLTVGVSQIDAKDLIGSLGTPSVWIFLLVALVGLPFFFFAERRALDPVMPPQLTASRQLILAGILGAGIGLGEVATVFLPPLAVKAFGVTESVASFLMLPLVMAMAFASPLTGRMLDKFGSKAVLVVGNLIATVGFALLIVAGQTMWGYILANIIIGLGMGAVLGSPLRYIMLAEAPLKFRASAQGLITVYTGIGQMLGSALVGAVASSHGGVDGYMLAFLSVGVLSAVMVVIALGLKGRHIEHGTTEKVSEESELVRS